jgi:hypothetical protein
MICIRCGKFPFCKEAKERQECKDFIKRRLEDEKLKKKTEQKEKEKSPENLTNMVLTQEEDDNIVD